MQYPNLTYQKLFNKGFIFYRTCDDDLTALFKRIYAENRQRKEFKSDKLDSDFKEFFQENTEKPYGNLLWNMIIFLNCVRKTLMQKTGFQDFAKE